MNSTIQSLDNDDIQMIQIISSDKVFSIDKRYVSLSNVIKSSLEEDPLATEFPFTKIKSDSMEKIIEYLNHHKGEVPSEIEKPIKHNTMREITNEWDADFIDEISKNRRLLFELISFSNYLDINPLLHLCCAKIALIMKDQPEENLRNVLLNA